MPSIDVELPSPAFAGRSEHRAAMSAIGAIHEHYRDLPSPIPHCLEVALGAASWVAHLFRGRPTELPWFRGSPRLSPARAALAVIAHREALYPDRVARAPSVASSWLRAYRRAAVRPGSSVRTTRRINTPSRSFPGFRPLARFFDALWSGWRSRPAGCTKPRTPLRAHPASLLSRDPPPESLLARGFRQGRFPCSPAKRSAFGKPKVPSIVGRSPEDARACSVNRS